MYNIIPWIFIDCSEIIFLPNSFTKLDSLTQIFDVQTARLRQVSSHSSWWITTSETCLQMLIWFLFQDNICICQKRLWMCLWFCRSCIMKLSRGFFLLLFCKLYFKICFNYENMGWIFGSFMMSETTPNEKSWALMLIMWKLRMDHDCLTFIFHIINSLKGMCKLILEKGTAKRGNNLIFVLYP